MSDVAVLKTCPICKKKHSSPSIFCSTLCKVISNVMDDLQQLDYRVDDIGRDVTELKGR